MSFLTLNDVSHYYFSKEGYTKALEDINFSIESGDFLSILGPSGCGKSTILSIISRLFKQTEGTVQLEGKDHFDSPLAVGYMLQQDYLFPWKTILDNVLIGPTVTKTVSPSIIEKAKEMLKEVGLSDVFNEYPSALSGGMRQRVALVRTLINDPPLLLLDEPFSALDYLTKLKLENLVSELLKSYDKTAILVTHDIGEAISMSDKIILMDASPGTIAKTFEIPESIRDEIPFYVRRHPDYQPLFDEVWKHFNKYETKSEQNERAEKGG